MNNNQTFNIGDRIRVTDAGDESVDESVDWDAPMALFTAGEGDEGEIIGYEENLWGAFGPVFDVLFDNGQSQWVRVNQIEAVEREATDVPPTPKAAEVADAFAAWEEELSDIETDIKVGDVLRITGVLPDPAFSQEKGEPFVGLEVKVVGLSDPLFGKLQVKPLTARPDTSDLCDFALYGFTWDLVSSAPALPATDNDPNLFDWMDDLFRDSLREVTSDPELGDPTDETERAGFSIGDYVRKSELFDQPEGYIVKFLDPNTGGGDVRVSWSTGLLAGLEVGTQLNTLVNLSGSDEQSAPVEAPRFNYGDEVRVSDEPATGNGGYVSPAAAGQVGTIDSELTPAGSYFVRGDGFDQYIGAEHLTPVEAPEAHYFQVGDTVRIIDTKDATFGGTWHYFELGQVVTVTAVAGDDITVEGYRDVRDETAGTMGQPVRPYHIEMVEAALADWERELLEGEASCTELTCPAHGAENRAKIEDKPVGKRLWNVHDFQVGDRVDVDNYCPNDDGHPIRGLGVVTGVSDSYVYVDLDNGYTRALLVADELLLVSRRA